MVAVELQGVVVETVGRRLLETVDLEIQAGEVVCVVGPSGSGKTTLLNTICGIARPGDGVVRVDGTDLTRVSGAERARLRLRSVGLVFQFGELLPELTLAQNVALPQQLLGVDRAEALQRAHVWLERVGLGDRDADRPAGISGGEAQRVAIARALAHQPAVVLADEPTGMLDEENTVVIADLLVGVAREAGTAVVVCTHNLAVAERADRVFGIRNRQLVVLSTGTAGVVLPAVHG